MRSRVTLRSTSPGYRSKRFFMREASAVTGALLSIGAPKCWHRHLSLSQIIFSGFFAEPQQSVTRSFVCWAAAIRAGG